MEDLYVEAGVSHAIRTWGPYSVTYTFGNPTYAYLALLISLIVSLVLGWSTWLRRESYQRRFRGWRLLWEMWISTLLLAVILFGLFYWYLFWHPFYQLTVEQDGTWVAQYELPSRSLSFDASSIVAVENNLERIPPIRFRAGRQTIGIELDDGRTIRSAGMESNGADAIYQVLQSHMGE